jgi:hypothetical protein
MSDALSTQHSGLRTPYVVLIPSATAPALYGNEHPSPSDEKPANQLIRIIDLSGMDVAIFRAKGEVHTI